MTEKITLTLKPFLRLNWEQLAWLILLVVALVSRFYDLQFGALHHDEVIHASWSWELYRGIGYQHNPIFHGPFMYHFQAFMYLLFGATDATARLGPAIFGTIIVLLPWFLRRELGRVGALLVGALLLISPSILYYSRHLRHDIFSATCILLMVVAVFRYLDGRRDRWLYVLAGAFTIGFMNHELTSIAVFVLWTFLAVLALGPDFLKTLDRLWQATQKWPLLITLIAILISWPVILLVCVVMALLLQIRKLIDRQRSPLIDLLVVLGTLTAFYCTPILVSILGKVLEVLHITLPVINTAQGPVQLVADPLNYGPGGILVTGPIFALVVIATILVGLGWDARRWLVCAIIFTVPFVLLYSTLLTNMQGLATGAVGSLAYWFTQHEYARGDQPEYYYLLIVPLYEFLALLLSLVGVVFIGLGKTKPLDVLAVPAPEGRPGMEIPADESEAVPLATQNVLFSPSLFPYFLVYWSFLSFVIFSWAGEKMPWLTIHIALPLAVFGGWTLAHIMAGADWLALARRGGAILAALVPLILIVAAALLGRQPFAGTTAPELTQTMQWLSLTIILAVLGGAWVWLAGWRVGVRDSLRVLAVTLVLILAAFTVRAAIFASFIHGDVTKDMLIYTQTTPDVPRMNDRVTEICQRLGTDYDTKLIHDEEMRTVLWWYWRDYKHVVFQDLNTSNYAPDNEAPVVWIGANHDDKVRPLMGQYNRYPGRMRWWFPEDYRGLTPERIASTFTDPGNRETMTKFLLYRDLPSPLGSWDFVCYIRKDVDAGGGGGVQTTGPAPTSPISGLEDQYKARTTTWTSVRTWGSLGAEEGQLNAPKGLAVGPDGNPSPGSGQAVYVADSGNHRIQVFTPAGAFVRSFGKQGPGPGELQEPWGVAVAPDGAVWVADTWNYRVQIFDAQGAPKMVITTTHSLGLYGPRAIAIDKDGNAFVTDTGNKRILKFSPTGELLNDWGTPGAWEAQFNEPVGIAIGPEGDIYIADTWNQRVQRFDGQMSYESQWPVLAWYGQGVLNKPYLAVASRGGYLYATDPEGARVIRWSGNGILLDVWGTPGSGQSELTLPIGVAVDQEGFVYVSDSGNNRIVVFPPLP